MPADPQYDKVHQLAKPASPHYHCHNKPRPVYGEMVRATSGETWPIRFTTQCQYDMNKTDGRCSGCVNGLY